MADLFSQIFERNGQWLTGRYIASEIIHHAKGRSPEVERDPRNESSVIIGVPRPKVKNEINGEYVSIDLMVPPKLMEIYVERLSMVMRKWIQVNPVGWGRLSNFLQEPLTDYTLHRMNAVLQRTEEETRTRGEKPEMWVITAEMFGFGRWNVPNLRFLDKAGLT